MVKDNSLSSPGQVQSKLEDVLSAAISMQETLENYARAYHTNKRKHEINLAHEYLKATGTNQKEKDSKALEKAETSAVYKDFVEAEANYEAAKFVMRNLELQASICQSLLKAERETA